MDHWAEKFPKFWNDFPDTALHFQSKFFCETFLCSFLLSTLQRISFLLFRSKGDDRHGFGKVWRERRLSCRDAPSSRETRKSWNGSRLIFRNICLESRRLVIISNSTQSKISFFLSFVRLFVRSFSIFLSSLLSFFLPFFLSFFLSDVFLSFFSFM